MASSCLEGVGNGVTVGSAAAVGWDWLGEAAQEDNLMGKKRKVHYHA